MNNKEFIQKYEELLNSGYCECNELNCLDNNPPKKILNIMKEQQQEIERLNNIIEEYKNANEYHQNIIHELETMKQPNQLYSENVKLRSENKRLNNIIKEVREYIESYMPNYDFDKTNLIKLLEILKGSDKE